MFFIGDDILHIPGYSSMERMLPHPAICFDADGTTIRNAIIGMNKKFHGGPKFFFYQGGKDIHFSMCFPYIQIPGHGHVTINMQDVAEFDYPEIMNINPVRPPVAV